MEIEYIVTGKQRRITREYNNLGCHFDKVIDLREREECPVVRQGENLERAQRLIEEAEEWILANAIISEVADNNENKEFRNMCRAELERRFLQL